MVRKYCLNNLDHIPLYIERRLHFQCFNRFYDAFREFPTSTLYHPAHLSDCLRQMDSRTDFRDFGITRTLRAAATSVRDTQTFESHEILHKTNVLRDLLDEYAPIFTDIEMEAVDTRNSLFLDHREKN